MSRVLHGMMGRRIKIHRCPLNGTIKCGGCHCIFAYCLYDCNQQIGADPVYDPSALFFSNLTLTSSALSANLIKRFLVL